MTNAGTSMRLRFDEASAELGRLIQSAYSLMENPEVCGVTHSIRLTVPIEPLDPLGWLSVQQDETKVFWQDRDASTSIAGLGIACCCRLAPGGSIRDFLQSIEDQLNPTYPDLRWYGGLRFDRDYPMTARDRQWELFGDGLFVLPRFEVVHTQNRMQLACNLLTDGADRAKKYEILDQLKALQFDTERESGGSIRVIGRSLKPTRDSWGEVMAGALDAIESRQIEKAVLARRTDLEFTDSVDHWALIQRWRATVKDSYLWAIQLAKQSCFMGISPERLYALHLGEVMSEAVAGTRPRGQTESEDSNYRHELAESDKEQREFDYVSATVEHALSLVCDEVTYDRKRSVVALATLQHLRRQFVGKLRKGRHNGDIIEALHPTPAVGGTPRIEAVNLIRKLEPFDRGWYAGPVGWIGLDAAEFAVGIRSGITHGDRLSLFAGAGIVAGSTIEGEWREIEHKSQSLSHTLGIA